MGSCAQAAQASLLLSFLFLRALEGAAPVAKKCAATSSARSRLSVRRCTECSSCGRAGRRAQARIARKPMRGRNAGDGTASRRRES